MSKRFLVVVFGLLMVLAMTGCTNVVKEIEQGEETLGLLWGGTVHKQINGLAATKWFPWDNIRNSDIRALGAQPDTDDAGSIDNYYKQQRTHAYMYNNAGLWSWGSADSVFNTEITEAGTKYGTSKSAGDRQLGYALHYFVDCGILVHSTWPLTGSPLGTDLLAFHTQFEGWIGANWTSGFNFYNKCDDDKTSIITVTGPAAGVKALAKATCAWTNTNSRDLWTNYVLSLYPKNAGDGNSTLVNKTTTMIMTTIKYTRGAIKYTIDKYSNYTY